MGRPPQRSEESSRRTFAKYLHTVSEAELRSWLNGHALPAWQAPCRKNLQGTCAVSAGRKASCQHMSTNTHPSRKPGADNRDGELRQGGSSEQRAMVSRREASGGEQRLTRGASGTVKASPGHCTGHGTGAAALRGDVEAAAAHMAMLARVGRRHGCQWFWESSWARCVPGFAQRRTRDFGRSVEVEWRGGPSCACKADD